VQWKHGPPGSENTFYALKCVSKEKITKHKQQEKIKSEENIMKSMVHPFIARCYSVMEDDLGKYFLMEALCGGELCELLYHETQFSEKWSMFYSASVLTAFGHMHQHKIAYRGKCLLMFITIIMALRVRECMTAHHMLLMDLY
jgi:serine/threonine protein kinase